MTDVIKDPSRIESLFNIVRLSTHPFPKFFNLN